MFRVIMGRRSLRAQIVKQLISLAQKWVKNGFSVIGWKWPKRGSKVGFRFDFAKKKGSETHFGPTLGHFQQMTTCVVIFFSLTEAPLPDPAPKSSPLGWDGRGGLSGWRGVGVVKEK